MFIEMTIGGLTIDPVTNMPFLLLKDKTEQRQLPIWIGLFEASAIATELENIKLARPMTHDLICLIVDGLKAKLQRVEIHDLRDNTFYARLILEKGSSQIKVDARPSDAIAVAIRLKVPILVAEAVLKQSKDVDLASKKFADKDKVSKEKWKEILENLSPEDFGKYKM